MYDVFINNNYEIVIADSIEEIFSILSEFDNAFSPSITDRAIDLNLYAEKLQKNAIVIYITRNESKVGFIAFYMNDRVSKEAYITQIAVKDRVKNRNIAKTLLDLCIKLSKNSFMNAIKLEVFTDNIVALKFYKKNGFYISGKATSKSVFMIKKI